MHSIEVGSENLDVLGGYDLGDVGGKGRECWREESGDAFGGVGCGVEWGGSGEGGDGFEWCGGEDNGQVRGCRFCDDFGKGQFAHLPLPLRVLLGDEVRVAADTEGAGLHCWGDQQVHPVAASIGFRPSHLHGLIVGLIG